MTTIEEKKANAEYMRKWRIEHRDKALALEKKFREKPERKEYMKLYFKNRRKKYTDKAREWRHNHREDDIARKKKDKQQAKKIVFEHYGNVCSCCGETEIMFLTIDHVNNDGNKDRRINGTHIYKRIIKEGFPSHFQILCRNCNWGKHVNGGTCPHSNIICKR